MTHTIYVFWTDCYCYRMPGEEATPDTSKRMKDFTFRKYQDFVKSTSIFPQTNPPSAARNLSYLFLGLVEEVGELHEKWSTPSMDSDEEVEVERTGKNPQNKIPSGYKFFTTLKELGDVCWYTTAMCNELELDIGTFIVEIRHGPPKAAIDLEVDAVTKIMQTVLGSVGGIIKKVIRDDECVIEESKKGKLLVLLRELFSYLNGLTPAFSMDLESTMDMNMDKIKKRFAKGNVQGSGDNRWNTTFTLNAADKWQWKIFITF